MEIIDAHAHIYPEKIADKAVEAIGNFYGQAGFGFLYALRTSYSGNFICTMHG